MSGNAALVAHLREHVRRHGRVTFAWFMEQALYHPEYGYYSSGRARIGRKGDYFTSVSVGPLFGQLMAKQFAEIWEQMGKPEGFTIVEEGAHSGDFGRDVMESGLLPEGIRYVALDRTSGTTLAATDPFCGIHFSNELIDSFPVHLVKWTGEEWRERHVDVADDRFRFVDLPIANAQLAGQVAKIPLPLPAGYETEVNLESLGWTELIARKLTRGFVIAVDYGFMREEFYAPHRTRGTLQSYAQQQLNADPLALVGEADLTAHVEWTSLIEQARAGGFELAGFTDQHHFITGLLDETIAQDAKSARALQTLMHPAFLGMKFQVLVLTKGVAEPAKLSGLRFAARVIPARYERQRLE